MVHEDVRLLSLNCEKCGAPLNMSKTHGVGLDLVECQFCGSSYKMVDEELQLQNSTPLLDHLPALDLPDEIEPLQPEASEKHSGFSAMSTIVAVMVACVALVIGVFVIANLQNSLQTSSLSTSAQTAINNGFNVASGAYNLLVVVLIVLAAVAILAVTIEGIGGGFSGKR